MKNKKKMSLLSNTISLYILVFSNYFFSFITVPYQTRVLGAEYYGRIGFALAFASFFQLVIDFGFILSATAEVSENRDNKNILSQILTSVTLSKILLIMFSFIIFLLLCLVVPKFNEDIFLYLLFFIFVATNSLLPDFLYRGLEKMEVITFRTVMIRLFFAIMLPILLKNKSQYYYIPILNIIGSVGALVFIFIHVFNKLGVKFVKVNIKDVLFALKKSSYFFYSRIATTVYDSINTLILGLLYPTGNIVGYFTSSNNLVKTVRNAFSPIADSLYPYMIKNKNYKLIKKILFFCIPPVLIGCIIVSIFAEPICELLFGRDFIDAAPLLRLLLPLIVIALPNYILGFPTLTPLGLANYANISTIIAAVIQIIGLILLYLVGFLNVYGICVLMVVSEFCVLLIRILAIVKNIKSIK